MDENAGERRKAPSPPRDLPAHLKKRWRQFWDAPMSAKLDPLSDGPLIERWFRLLALDEELRQRAEADGATDVAARLRLAGELRLTEREVRVRQTSVGHGRAVDRLIYEAEHPTPKPKTLDDYADETEDDF